MLRAALSAVTAPPRGRKGEVAPGSRFARNGDVSEREPLYRRIDWWRSAPVLLALLFAVVYLIWQPRTVDLAAHTFRADLFGQEGFTIWNGQWYGGHHTPAYSIISPPIAWLLGPPLALAIAAVSAAALFEPLARGYFGAERSRWGAIWFGVGHGHPALHEPGCPSPSAWPSAWPPCSRSSAAATRSRCSSPCSARWAVPVAGLFLAMAGVAFAIAAGRDRTKRREGIAIAAGAFIPPVLLAWAFPEGGWAPVPVHGLPADPVVRDRLPAGPAPPREGAPLGRRALRPRRHRRALHRHADGRQRGAARARSSVDPCSCARSGTGRGCGARGPCPLLAVVLVPLAFWQWSPAVRDVIKYLEDPAAKSHYFEPLRQYLATLPDQRRIEIPFTRSHWEGAEIALHTPLARGWLRQLDTGRNPIFYRGPINQLTYASWLAENAVRYVALPSAKPDKSSYGERALIEHGLPYLRLRWRSDDWRVYEVVLPSPFVIPQKDANIVLEELGSDQVLLDVKKPGEAIVRVRWTPYWFARGACVEPYGNWTRIIAPEKGFVRMSTRFSPERLFSRGRRCNGGAS